MSDMAVNAAPRRLGYEAKSNHRAWIPRDGADNPAPGTELSEAKEEGGAATLPGRPGTDSRRGMATACGALATYSGQQVP